MGYEFLKDFPWNRHSSCSLFLQGSLNATHFLADQKHCKSMVKTLKDFPLNALMHSLGLVVSVYAWIFQVCKMCVPFHKKKNISKGRRSRYDDPWKKHQNGQTVYTLPQTNCKFAPENRPFAPIGNEYSIPTIHFQVRNMWVSGRVYDVFFPLHGFGTRRIHEVMQWRLGSLWEKGGKAGLSAKFGWENSVKNQFL